MRRRRILGLLLLVFSVSCTTTGMPTDRTAQNISEDRVSLPDSSAARSVTVTDVRVKTEGSGETSIAVIADESLVDYASFAVQTPPSLVIDLPHAKNAMSQSVNVPPGSPIVRIRTMQLQDRPIPVLRLMFDLNRLLPYRVEVIRNSLQILVSAEVSEQVSTAEELIEPEQLVRSVVDNIESPAVAPGERAEKGIAEVKPTVSATSEKSTAGIEPSEQIRQTAPTMPTAKRPASAGASKSHGSAVPGVSEQETVPSRSAPANRPTTPMPATSKVTTANRRLSLDFKGADLDDLLRLVSEVSGLNIVVAHGLKDRKDRDVTVRLTNVEWRQALDVILRTKGLSYEQDGNLIYVGSKSEIQKTKEDRAKDIEQATLKNFRIDEERRKIEEAKQKLEDEKRKAEEEERRYAEEAPCTKVIRLAHMRAPDMKKHLERLKTRRGSIDLEETTNTLIINDVQSACQKMVALAKELDTPPKEPFVTKLLPFNYAKATDLKTHLASLKTKDGSVIVDERSSRIIVKDLPEAVERIEALLKQIDIQTPQVLIEARIVEATRKFSQSLGIQWGGTGIPTGPGATTGSTVFGGSGAGPIRFPNLTSPSNTLLPPPSTGGGVPFLGPVPLAMNLPVPSPHFAVGMTIGSLANRFLVGAQLSAAESEGKIRTLSSPRVATQDNEEAEIKQGTQVPYTTIDSSGRTVVQFQDAFIKLKVKPHITPDGRVSMKVEAERSFPGNRVDFSGGFVFPINTRKATTNILVQNGSTLVIGGLLQSTETIIEDKVPTFGDIPILGWLFKRHTVGPDERVELLIFLTPSILQESRL